MLKMNQLKAAYGLQFGDVDEMRIFGEYTDFERELSEALAGIVPRLEAERSRRLSEWGNLCYRKGFWLYERALEAERREYERTYLLKSA